MLCYLILFLYLCQLGYCNHCYSCSGTCHSEQCNCQMGSCSSNQCFIEKKPTEEKGVYKITKGCLRRAPRTLPGCDYDHFSDHVLCVCNGPFCNDHIFVRPIQRRNVTCRKCTERDPDCDSTCLGQWCHEDSTTGASGCGFGPPALPFFYRGPELLYYRNKLCVTMSRGAGKPRKHCICNSNLCNAILKTDKYSAQRDTMLRSRSLALSSPEIILPFQTCINCEINSLDSTSLTSSCKQNKCVGHYCTYASQRHLMSGAGRGTSMHSITEKQGCLNVTDSSQMQLGCSRKWMPNEYEEVLCACEGDLCNRDEFTALSPSITLSSFIILVIITIL